MEQYNVFILTIKELLAGWMPIKIALILIAVVISYRLPEIIVAIRH